MLAYILALFVGLGSLGIYLGAFFLPEIHRKSDFYWSGVGLFYALVLWVCAGRITGGVLLGQIAGVALLAWFTWQTLTLRWELIPVEQQTPLPSPEVAAQKLKDVVASLTQNLQSKVSNLSLPAGISQIPERLTGLFNNVKERIGEKLSAAKKPKDKPIKDKNKPFATSTTTIKAEVVDSMEAEWDEPAPAPVTTTTEKLAANPEPTASKAPSAIEDITPKVELTPPAQPGTKKSLDVDIPATTEVVSPPVVTPEATSKAPGSPFSELVTSPKDEEAAKDEG